MKLFSDFIEAVQKKNYKEGLKEAFDTIYLLDKCYESAREHKTIELRNE